MKRSVLALLVLLLLPTTRAYAEDHGWAQFCALASTVKDVKLVSCAIFGQDGATWTGALKVITIVDGTANQATQAADAVTAAMNKANF
jgi:hypothetical protein